MEMTTKMNSRSQCRMHFAYLQERPFPMTKFSLIVKHNTLFYSISFHWFTLRMAILFARMTVFPISGN